MKIIKGKDIFLLIYLILFAALVLVFTLIIHFNYDGYTIIWITPTITLLLAISYCFIKKRWFLYICIAPLFIFFSWLFLFHTIMNQGFIFKDYIYIMITYIFPLLAYIYLGILTFFIIKERKHKNV